MLNVTASVVPFTTDLMVGIFGPITCSGNDWLIEVLQYTEYSVTIPFFGMGTDQLADSAVGDPGTGNIVKLSGEDGTEKNSAKLVGDNRKLQIFTACSSLPGLS